MKRHKRHSNSMDNIDAQEQVEQLERAMELINEAHEIIAAVVNNDASVEAYLLRNLSHIANDDGNPYDTSIPKIIEEIKEDPEKYNFVDHSGDYKRNK